MTSANQPTISTIRPADLASGERFPYLPTSWSWEIRNIPFACWPAEAVRLDRAGLTPTLRLVKDDKIVDIHIPEMTTVQFMAHWGLDARLSRGGFVLSKRLSRLMHSHRYWAFFDPAAVRIVHRHDWDGALWDGCGRISRRFLIEQLLPQLATLPEHQRQRYERELRTTGRFEITVMHDGGQEKGDVLVVDELPGDVDLMFPAGAAKGELRQTGMVFVGLPAARHAADEMRIDVQSLINLYPFLDVEQLLGWLESESDLFLQSLAHGQAQRLYPRLGATSQSLAALSDWHVGEYLASGGDPRWFAAIQRALGRQHLERLVNQAEQKLRLPIPGGRYYIFPATVGGRELSRGQICLERGCATAWVNDEDWIERVVPILGGCDGDDALWTLPFTDQADGLRKLLVWRSPNQVGEYLLLQPTAASDTIEWAVGSDEVIAWPALDSRKLPPRIDERGYQYGTLTAADGACSDEPYQVAAMSPVAERAMANVGTLGAFCNLTMLQKALYDGLPDQLPASMEAIIDGSVKTFADLTPVRTWLRAEARQILARQTAVPKALRRRLVTLLPFEERGGLRLSTDHWLDRLMDGLQAHQASYQAKLEDVVAACRLPIELFASVDETSLALGRALRQGYADVLRTGGSLDEARDVSEQFLTERRCQMGDVLRGAAVACYASGQSDGAVSDSVLWQLGRALESGGRQMGIAQRFIEALREIGLLGEPVWTTEGLQWHYATDTPKPVGEVVTLNGVWFNWLRATNTEQVAEMALVPAERREQAKREVDRMARRRLTGASLHMVAEDDQRLVGYTARGNCFGYVKRGQEHRLDGATLWRIRWAMAVDGNVQAVLEAVEG